MDIDIINDFLSGMGTSYDIAIANECSESHVNIIVTNYLTEKRQNAEAKAAIIRRAEAKRVAVMGGEVREREMRTPVKSAHQIVAYYNRMGTKTYSFSERLEMGT
jgi:hypothetical protein